MKDFNNDNRFLRTDLNQQLPAYEARIIPCLVLSCRTYKNLLRHVVALEISQKFGNVVYFLLSDRLTKF